ncbi:MAG: hypothetical protein Q7U05_03060 [Polaromonas sp.]|jgi:hypothetical protein|nr:hypothetical protein [Polaromonas sp.]
MSKSDVAQTGDFIFSLQTKRNHLRRITTVEFYLQRWHLFLYLTGVMSLKAVDSSGFQEEPAGWFLPFQGLTT